MKICLKCNNIFALGADSTMGNRCLIRNCNGEIIEVEDCMINVIEQLNKKGYPTIHTAVNSESEFIEIIFDEKVHPEAFAFLPIGFISEISSGHCLRLHKNIIGETELERLDFIRQASIELVEWIEKLSSAKKIIVDLTLDGESDVLLCTWELHQNLFLFPLYVNASSQLVTIVSPENVELIENKIEPFADEIGYEIDLQIKTE